MMIEARPSSSARKAQKPFDKREGARMDVELHYREEGTGEPLILLHGNGKDGSYFEHQMAAFMDERGIGRAHVLGFSDGGNIALVFALAHPERVGKLVLNGANLDGRGVRASVQLPIVAGYRAASLFGRRSEQARRKAEMLGLMVNDPNIAPAELAELGVPTLVVAGTRDMIKEAHTRLIATSIPNAQLAFVEGDHFVAHKSPGAFNAVVEGFLRP